MTDSIIRYTATTGETITAFNKIDFNTGTVPDSTGKLVRTGFRMVSDMNTHPNPDTQLNQIQDSLLGVVEVTIAGYFINHLNSLGPRNLYNWSIGENTNSVFQKGRFGLTLGSFKGILTLTPSTGLNGTGYMLSEVDVQDIEDPRQEIPFIARFFLNGTVSESTIT